MKLLRRSSLTNPMKKLFAGLLILGMSVSRAAEKLPQSTTFVNVPAFKDLVTKATANDWKALPMGDRVARFGLAMRGTPYKGFTLEIDDHVESPCVNFSGLDCWTFFETSLGLARMIEKPKSTYGPSDLLSEIETTRYWGGQCSGKYLERIHYLASWFNDNEKRGNILNVTRKIGPTSVLTDRTCEEMTVLWKKYRYLAKSPSLLPEMGQIEAKESALAVPYIPKDKVKESEKNIRNGDIIGIVTAHTGGHCSHVGLAYRTEDGVCHFMHASSLYKKVVLDKSISGYLSDFKSDIGIIVGRPISK